jgi:hypothetical protein
LCSTLCQAPFNPGCGWSSPRDLCVRGASTSSSEFGLGSCAPTPSTTLAPTAAPVASSSCAASHACEGGVESIRRFANGTLCYCASGCETLGACCPDYVTFCVTTAPSIAAVVCASITCSDQCSGGCGWSRNANVCKAGARTTASEVGLGSSCPTLAPSPFVVGATVAPTPSPPVDCANITCSDQCSGECGWSTNQNRCKAGGRTTASEGGLGPGCGSTLGPSINLESAAPTPVAASCASITCSDQCSGVCGWSRNRNVCKAGARTTASEVGLGAGCTTASPTTVDDPSGRTRSPDNPNSA